MRLKRPASVVIDSATYLFTISSPDNIAMSLYDINYSISVQYAINVFELLVLIICIPELCN